MMRDLLLRLRAILKRTAVDREIDEELLFHVESQIESYKKAGLDHTEAVRRAHLEFGGVNQVKEEYRDALGTRILEECWRDLHYAVRSLSSTGIVSIVVVLSLALGIGSNTAMFSLVNALLLRSLPVPQPDRLAIIGDTTRDSPAWSNPVWEQVRNRPELFAGAFAWSTEQFNLARGGEAQFVDGLFASGDFFEVLGVRPALGRTFAADDDRRGGGPDGPVAVISDDFWRRRFGGSQDAVGKPLNVGSIPFTVIGVTPPGFFGPDVGRRFDVILPIGTEPLLRGAGSALDLRTRNWLRIMIRLKTDQTPDAAVAVLRGIQPQLRDATLPDLPQRLLADYIRAPLVLTPASDGRSDLREQYGSPMVILMVIVGVVLLIACLNIANLMLARGDARRHEMSLRLALGASRIRLARLILVEAAVLSGVGAVLGIALSRWMSELLVQQLSTPGSLVFLELKQDWHVLGFAAAVATTTTLLLGVMPAWRSARGNPGDALREQGRGTLENGRVPVAAALVSGQVALSLVLVVAAGLFIRTFSGLALQDVGFARDRILVVNVTAPMTQYTLPRLVSVYERIREAVGAVPGVERAALSDITPVSGSSRIALVDSPLAAALLESERTTFVNVISSDWLATYRTRLLAGRDIAPTDRQNTAPVALVNGAFARTFLGRQNPVGQTVAVGIPGMTTRFEIIGLVEDAVYRSLRDPAPPTIYTASMQRAAARPSVNVSVLTRAAPPAQLSRAIAAAISQVDPNLVLRFSPLTDQVNAAVSQERILALLSGFFGVLALLLAGLGLYGLAAYAVSRRRAEIAIRMALGAKPGGVVRMIMLRISVMVAAGVVVGAILSFWASRFVNTLVWGLEPQDAGTFIGAAVLLTTVGALAAWLPARRAAQIDPAVVLRGN